MTSRSLVTLRRYICRHRAPRMREIFGHVTAVISRIAHACAATWRRVTLHAWLNLQSTDHSSPSSSSSSSSSSTDRPSDRHLQSTSVSGHTTRCPAVAARHAAANIGQYTPILYVPAPRVSSQYCTVKSPNHSANLTHRLPISTAYVVIVIQRTFPEHCWTRNPVNF